jgi:hypothetical protein
MKCYLVYCQCSHSWDVVKCVVRREAKSPDEALDGIKTAFMNQVGLCPGRGFKVTKIMEVPL